MSEKRFLHSINDALSDALAADETVLVLGEDVGEAGGAFKATRGLLDQFGPNRIFDTPISEAAITGIGVGAAISGMRPIIEIMFMDFITLSMDMMVNQAAKARSMFGGQGSVPMVLRTPHGGGLNAGPQHSQCLEAWFTHIPGLKVVCPSNPADAYSLLRASIDDPDPVIFVENKALYSMKGEVPDDPETQTIGKANIVRKGSDATIVSYGRAVHWSVEAASLLEKEGLDVEVVDLRTLQPWDEATILESLSRTHNLVITHEAVEAFGVGAEIAARMADIGFDELDGPIVRVGAPFAPSPFGKTLEDVYLPSPKGIADAVRRSIQ